MGVEARGGHDTELLAPVVPPRRGRRKSIPESERAGHSFGSRPLHRLAGLPGRHSAVGVHARPAPCAQMCAKRHVMLLVEGGKVGRGRPSPETLRPTPTDPCRTRRPRLAGHRQAVRSARQNPTRTLVLRLPCRALSARVEVAASGFKTRAVKGCIVAGSGARRIGMLRGRPQRLRRRPCATAGTRALERFHEGSGVIGLQ